MMAFLTYSKKFIERSIELGVIKQMIGLKKKSVIMWSLNYPFLYRVTSVFKQSKEDDQELINFYGKYVDGNMSNMRKARLFSIAVNARISYSSDMKVYGVLERWVSPIDVHRKRYDDCDGYAVLICYLCRLFGLEEWEVFVRAGDAILDNGETMGHANVIVLDRQTLRFYYLEGSFYPRRAHRNFGKLPVYDNSQYGNTWWITNDKESYGKRSLPWLRFKRR